jgi:hypothetical protein
MVENSSIPLLLNSPTNKHDNGGQGLAIVRSLIQQLGPPSLKVEIVRPRMEVDGRNANPTFHHPPKALGVAAMEEKVSRCFLSLVAKRTPTAICSTPSR